MFPLHHRIIPSPALLTPPSIVSLQGLLTAVPLEEAVRALRSKWNGFFAADGAAKTARNPRLARITERCSSLGPIPEAEASVQ